jgi:hypothetical protein
VVEHWLARASLLLGQRGGELVVSGRNVLQFLFHDTNVAIAAACALMTDTCPTVVEHNLVTPTLRVVLHPGDALAFSGYTPEQSLEAATRMLAPASPRQIIAAAEVYRIASDELRRNMQPRSAGGADRPGPADVRLYEVDWRRIVPGPRDDDEAALNPTHRIVFSQATQRVQPLSAPDPAPPARRKRKIVLPKQRAGPVAAPTPAAAGRPGPQADTAPLLTPRLRLICGTEIAVVDNVVPAVSIGRSPDRDLIVKAAAVSRQHAEILFRDGAFYLADHSANGTYVYDAQGREEIVHKCEMTLPASGCMALGASKESNEARIVLFRLERSEPHAENSAAAAPAKGARTAASAAVPGRGVFVGDGI